MLLGVVKRLLESTRQRVSEDEVLDVKVLIFSADWSQFTVGLTVIGVISSV